MGALNKLSDARLRGKLKRRRLGDGGGLYLQVGRGGSKSWVFRYRVHNREREMGLGTYPEVSLDVAREKARACRELRQQAIDPIENRDALALAEAEAKARALSFQECAETYIRSHEPGWKNAKHRQQWTNTLETYVYPTFGELPVQAIDTALVSKVLSPIWTAIPETAGRVRGRIEAILDWARVSGFREGENPARWRGHLDELFPPKSKVRPVKHHSALPFDDVPAFVTDLRQCQGVAPLALEFLILTVCRTTEVQGALWSEIDEVRRLWIVPPGRMKRAREHRVPLTGRALEILEAMRPFHRMNDYIFPGLREGKPLSNGAFLALLERMGRGNITAHGFRSSFDDWAAERTNFPREVAEMALSHVVKDKVEAAYRRGDLLEKRRALMDAWATFCETPANSGAVLPFVVRAAQ